MVAGKVALGFMNWEVIQNSTQLFANAVKIHQSTAMISFWDSNIIAAALEAEIDELWSEDLSRSQWHTGFKIINPFG